jgi:hypothetical protein
MGGYFSYASIDDCFDGDRFYRHDQLSDARSSAESMLRKDLADGEDGSEICYGRVIGEVHSGALRDVIAPTLIEEWEQLRIAVRDLGRAVLLELAAGIQRIRRWWW